MHEYKCLKCKRLFEDSLAQNRCPTYKCQSRQIKDVTPTHKGVTYRNIDWTMEDEGQKNAVRQDRHGRKIRQLIKLYNDNEEREQNGRT